MNEWTSALDDSEYVDVVYLDISKAFDSVSLTKLLCKLGYYGIDGDLFLWIKAFLTNRKQRVWVGSQFSEWKNVGSGVPEGSVLGPLLFVLYINDIVNVVKHSSIKLFADDCKLYFRYKKNM